MPISFGAGGKSTPKRKSRLPSTLPTNGLLVYLDAANPNSYPGAGSTWFDLSGNNLHATLYNGAAQNKNVAGGVMQFSSGNTGTPSTADYILTQTPDLSTSNYTVIFASRYTILSGDGNSGRGRIVSGYNNNWLAGQHSGSQARYYANNWVNNPLTTDDDAKWRIYAATGDYTNDQWTMLINNSQVVSNNGGTNGPNGLILGKGGVGSAGYPGPSQEPSKGQIAFLLVWNRVLTTQELTDVYNLFKNRFIVADSNLKLHIDAADSASYSGSGTAVSDISGNGLNCTLTNGPTFSNGAFNLDATDDVILTNSTVDLRSDFTLEGWFSLNVDTTASFFGHGNAGAVNSQSLHTHFLPGSGPNGNRGQLFAFYNNDASSPTTNVNRPKNTWYHVVFTYSNSSPFTKKMYVNGVDLNITAEQTQAAYAAAPTVLRMGQTFSATGGGNCKIAQARYYNKVLTASEVLQNYNATKGIFYPSEFPASISNLEVWLKADSGVYNSSSNLITADNTSTPAWEDKSGNNRSVVNTNAINQPTLRTGANGINNLPALSFDGLNDKLIGTWSGYNTSKPYTIFNVVNYTTFGDGIIYTYSLNNFTGFEGDAVRFLNSGGRKLRLCSNAIVDTGDLSGPLPPSGTLLLCFQHSGVSGTTGTFTIRSNGQQIYQNTSVTRPATVVGSDFAIGAQHFPDGSSGSLFAGKICEHLYFSKILNNKEINMVEAYLNAKWDCYKFNPSDISNLALWVDADDASTLYQSSGGSLAAADGDVVGEWLDKSGNGRHMTQATAGNKPILKKNQLNGKQMVRGDGVDDRLQQLAVAPNYIVNSTCTIFAVIKQVSTKAAAQQRPMGNTNGGVGTNGFNLITSANTGAPNYWVVRDSSGSSAGDISMTGTFTLGQAYVYTFRLNASGAQSFINGFQNVATTAITTLGTPTQPFTLFQDGTPTATNFAANSDIGEVIVYSKSLTDQERISIENYLRRKWGI